MANKPTFNNPYQGSRDRPVTITLACGCRIHARTRPARPTTTYPCSSGQGHGYNLMWEKWEERDGKTDRNPQL